MLSGSQKTRIGGHGAGMAYAGFTAKALALIKFLPRVIAVMGRTISTYILNRDASSIVQDRESVIGELDSERSIVIQRGKDK